MSFDFLWLNNSPLSDQAELAEIGPPLIREVVPDIRLHLTDDSAEAAALIAGADAAYGVIGPDLLAAAPRLRWIQSPQAGPDPGYYHPDLVASEVVVTNMRGIYSDHISAHVMAWLLGFSRGLPTYHDRQRQKRWQTGAPTTFLPEATALIVGVGGIGAETARLCAAFGMRVLGVDARLREAPPGMAELAKPEDLDRLLPEADFVVLTVPETPATQGFFDASCFTLMKPGSFFINIGRGATVVLDDLNQALRQGGIAGAALDVFQIEPLPPEHPLWDAPGMLITPHVATAGPYLNQRRAQVITDNCVRFANGEPLNNVVDKANWF
ncbi:MAG: D-2-hydroxyacid dehydrogenase [Alphaproteobacteria bacterium]|jgi:phosphoglycerate dehydrogenase-like enzyme|nr:D-2-hydroxyacid dehydrogenase [Alphaproteobacteria bacterium]MDP6564454.1 D-2-hydroxyacid dehydrogenase [Alphaproteobacteria bacterium]MDP6813409.1 D-2-hydroxyacid dehydrogenase [Alphaproteobacteria bacterium]